MGMAATHLDPAHTMMTVEQQNRRQMSFDDVSILYVRIFRVIGLLPFEGRSFGFSGTRALLAFFILMSIINWTMLISYLCSMRGVTLDFTYEVLIVASINLRYYMIIGKRSRLLAMMGECRAIWSEYIDDKGHCAVVPFERQLRVLLILLVGSFFFVSLLYTGNALIHRLPNLEPNGTRRRTLPYKWYVPHLDGPGYWSVFALQQTVFNCASLTMAGCDTVMPFLVAITSGYFRHLASYFYSSAVGFKFAVSGQHSMHQYCQFIRHVKLHQRLLTFCIELEQFNRMMCLVLILSTGYSISLVGIKISGSGPEKYKYIPVLLVCLYRLLLCHWIPDILFTESGEVATAAYFSSVMWMKSPVGKLLIVIIARAHNPVQMTAGGIVNLSLESFGSMMSSAVSFFMLLRNFDW